MNKMAMMSVQEIIPITRMLPIDDAFIGVLMRRLGLENNFFDDVRFKSWGFKPFNERQFDVCHIEKIIYCHKFLPKELNCFWPKFIASRKKCTETGYKYEESFPLCKTKGWHKNRPVAPAKLDGEDYHKCGPDWDNAGCSVNPSDWVIRQPNNGPCCSRGGHCGITTDHCDCADCVDFRIVEKGLLYPLNTFFSMSQSNWTDKNLEQRQSEAHTTGICCNKLLVTTQSKYGGTYFLLKDEGRVENIVIFMSELLC